MFFVPKMIKKHKGEHYVTFEKNYAHIIVFYEALCYNMHTIMMEVSMDEAKNK